MTSRIHYDEHGWHVLDADGRVLGTFDAEADAKAFACSLRKATGKEKQMKLNSDQVRQGDVLLVRADKMPSWAKEAQRDDHGRVVVEYGESSGHGHAFRGAGVTGFRAETSEMAAMAGLDAVLVGGSTELLRHEFVDGRHAEHEPVALAPGAWVRAIQVEYDPDQEQRVAD